VSAVSKQSVSLSHERIMKNVILLGFLTVFLLGMFGPASPADFFVQQAYASEEAHGHDDGGDVSAKLNPIKFDTDTALWTAVVFLILVAILGKFAFKPIVTALDQREQAVADNIAAAEKANHDAKELLGQYHQKLIDAQEEVKQLLDAGKKEAESAGLAILEKAKQAAESERVRATKEIEAATTGALQELAEKSATLATTLAGKIIKTKIDASAHKDLIDNAIQGFSRQ
jgi:F-type H+-transporting ATPase subunit b